MNFPQSLPFIAPQGVTRRGGAPLTENDWQYFSQYGQATGLRDTSVIPALKAAFGFVPEFSIIDGVNGLTSVLGGPPEPIQLYGLYVTANAPTPAPLGPLPLDVSAWTFEFEENLIVSAVSVTLQDLDNVGNMLSRQFCLSQVDRGINGVLAPAGPYLNITLLEDVGVMQFVWSPKPQQPITAAVNATSPLGMKLAKIGDRAKVKMAALRPVPTSGAKFDTVTAAA